MRKKQHRVVLDHLGQEITVGSPVAFYHKGLKTMRTGRISKVTKINVRVAWTSKLTDLSRTIHPREVVAIAEDIYAYHCLRDPY